MTKNDVTCTKCHNVGDNCRIRRPLLVKVLLPFLPIRKYICFSCLKTFYIKKKNEDKITAEVLIAN